ncbi:MAG: 23S rRNA pseudouridine(1911/1915/1917) synthase RluD [Chromatiales bacterium]|jgi:23S rRNA pseudouridine1911/1915/1917 synthase|nr:23S rRNA pseudouridine(1911/1915/1917) synthase RluD [Chromatiales bacterium]
MTGEARDLLIPPAAAGRRLDQVLAELLPEHSRSRIKQWIVAGQVQLDGAAVEPRTRVQAGQSVTVREGLPPAMVADRAPAAEAMVLPVVYEDDDVIVIDKPAGLVVHPGAGNRTGTLANGLLAYAPAVAALPRCGLVHRLDKDTTGLMVVARSPAAHTRLTRDIEARRVLREYRALVVGAMTAGGVVEARIGRHPAHRTRMAVTGRGRPAATHYRVLGRLRAHTFIAVRLETGRTHQIRVHMAHIRHPVVGDRDYAGRLIIPQGATPAQADALRGFRRQALHAWRLAFTHPVTGEPLEFTAPLPPDFRALLAALAGDAAALRLETLPWPGNDPVPVLGVAEDGDDAGADAIDPGDEVDADPGDGDDDW